MRRSVVVIGVVAAATALAGGGWLAGRRIESPDAAARRAAPPPASTITVPVEERALSTNVVTRGSVRFDAGTVVHLAKASATAGIVTRSSPAVGSTLNEGALVVEVDSRPAFAFAGELPAYRDLVPGTQGDDVRQLQAALTRLGVFAGDADGTFGPTTQDAVTAYYRKMGYEPRPPSKVERDALTEAQRRVDAAQETVRRAGDDLTRAGEGPKESQRLQLDAAVRRAQSDLAKARAARQPAIDAANAAATDASLTTAAANAAHDAAVAALTKARAGTNPDTGAPITPTELAGYERAATEADLMARRTAREQDAARDKADATPAEQDELIAEAQAALTLAQRTRDEAVANPDTATLQAALDDANRALADAQRSLADAQAAAGVIVPESELVFLKDLPRRVDESSARRGESLPERVMAVSGTDLVIDATVSAADRRFVRKDITVKLDEQSLGVAFDGTVTFVADEPGASAAGGSSGSSGSSGGSGSSGAGAGAGGGTAPGGQSGASGSGSDRFALRIKPGTLPANVRPTDLRGVNLRVTIPVRSTNGKVMAVPVAALSSGSDGSARVDVEDSPGAAPRTVNVRTGLSSQGFVEVTPIDGSLKVGDRVIVGRKATTTTTTASAAAKT